jgi:glycosyltransferase involved in cell wall biosynthesis
VIAALHARPPDAWFTYHVYYKAPDWIGPRVAAALGIPYVIAEPSHAPKQAHGPWRLGHDAAANAIARADALFCLTRHDMTCTAPLVQPADKLSFLPPFLDVAPFAEAARHRAESREAMATAFGLDAAVPWLLSVAMMRPGHKLASYRQLATAVAALQDQAWQLVVVGGGPAEGDVRAALDVVAADRVVLIGTRRRGELPGIYAAANIYAWPAVGEAYGMALLEAQASGVPVVAGRIRGVPDVVRDGETALLAPADDTGAMAAQIRMLLQHRDLRARLGAAASEFVASERTIEHAAARLSPVLERLRAPRPAHAAP